MKDSLILPVVFLGLLLACAILFTLGSLMYLWDTQFVPASSPSLAWAVASAPTALRGVFIPATLTALFVTIMRIARRPGIALLSIVLVLVVSAACLFYGLSFMDRLLHATGTETGRSYNPLVANTFNVTKSATLFPEEVRDDSLGPTLLVVPAKNPSFTVEARGKFDPTGWSAVFSKQTVPIVPRNPTLTAELAPRGFLAALFGDMTSLGAYLQRARASSMIAFAIALGGVVLFSVSCVAFAWLTRWPVLNIILLALCFRALFWLSSLFATQVATDTFALVVPKQFMPVAPSIGLGALAVLIMLWNIFFIRPPARQ
ncbi:MAG TPA: hypothetical protein VMW69_08060 [Spirochaetia bacterium]|nr:hypothetical protein [Spirochaetia bacterium]